MMVRLFIRLCLLLSVGTLLTSQPYAYTSRTSATEPLAVIPFKFENNRIRLTASLDGVPLSLLLDTGASTTVLFSNMEPVIQAIPLVGEAQVVFPALDQTVTGRRLAPVTLTFENLDVSLGNVIQLDDKSDLQARLLLRYDGILGQEFFQQIYPGSRSGIARAKTVRAGYRPRAQLPYVAQALYAGQRTPHTLPNQDALGNFAHDETDAGGYRLSRRPGFLGQHALSQGCPTDTGNPAEVIEYSHRRENAFQVWPSHFHGRSGIFGVSPAKTDRQTRRPDGRHNIEQFQLCDRHIR